MKEKGFTMIELLIALVLAIVAAAAAYALFSNTFNFSVLHSQSAEMQRETRIAMDIMTRDIRSAGFGVIEPLSGAILVSPVLASNNVDQDPEGNANQLDRITLVGGYQNVGTLNVAAAEGDTQVTLDFTAGFNPADLIGRTVTIEGFYLGTVTSRVGTTNTFNVSPGLNRDYSTQNSMSVIQRIVYRVGVPAPGAEPVLFRDLDSDNNGTIDSSDIIASGIEDLQIAYLLNTGGESNNPPVVALPGAPPIRAVRVSILSRAPDPKLSATSVSTRPALEDHAAGAGPDRFHRRLITKVTEVRNLGFL